MKHHLDYTACFNTSFIDREPAALDRQETQFFERCRRDTVNVPYPHHIPVPRPAMNAQHRGLTYQSAAGHHQCMALPVVRSAFSLSSNTCSIVRHLRATATPDNALC